MEIFVQIRRQKTTIFLDTKENATVMELKRMLSGIIRTPPEDQKLIYNRITLEDREELRHYFTAKATCPAELGLCLRDKDTGDFEPLNMTPYSEPPELPSVMEREEESL